MPRGKDCVEPNLTGQKRKRAAKKEWEEGNVRKRPKLSGNQVAQNARAKQSSVVNEAKRMETAKVRKLSHHEKGEYKSVNQVKGAVECRELRGRGAVGQAGS